MEILNKLAGSRHGLCANPRAPFFEIDGTDFRNKLLQGAAEPFLAQRLQELLADHSRILAEKAPQTRKAEGVAEVGWIDRPKRVTLACKSEHGVGTRFDTAVYEPGKMHAEKRQLRSSDRIDQVPHQLLGRCGQPVVFTSEGDDSNFPFLAG